MSRALQAYSTCVDDRPGKLVLLDEVDRERLNRFVRTSPLAHYKQVYEWGSVVEYEGTRPVRLGVERDGELCASLALYVRQLPGTRFTVLLGSRGPVFDPTDRTALERLTAGIRQVAHEHRAIFARVDPECLDEDQQARAALLGTGFRHLAKKNWSQLNDPRIVMCLDLTPPDADLLRSMRDTHRRHIRRVAKNAVSIRHARDEQDVGRLRELMVEVSERRAFPVRASAYYQRLWSDFIQRGQGTIVLAEKGCDVIGGFLTLAVGQKAWLLYTCLSHNARPLHPNEALWWEGLQTAKRHGATLFNFGGSGTDWPPEPDSPWYSVYAFKRGFGADAVYLTGYYDLVFRPGLYRIFRAAEEQLLPRLSRSTLFARLTKS